MEIIKKITFKALAGVPGSAELKAAVKEDRTELPNKLCVLGFATGLHHQINQDTGQTYEGLAGDFVAYCPETPDEKYASAVAYLPDIAGNLIKGKLSGGNQVEFAIEIGVRLPKEGEKSPVGYIFTVRPLVPPAENDPLQNLLARVASASQPAIEAPGKGEKAKKSETAE